MNVATRRATMRGVGSLALFASAALVFASPAYAEGTDGDLELTVSATTVTADESAKAFATTVTNKGSIDSGTWTLEYDLSGLDDAIIKAGSPQLRGCELSGDKLTCAGVSLTPGQSIPNNLPFALEPVAGKKGAAGSFTVTAVSATDPNTANNAATVKVTVPAKGVDLLTVAEDVYQVTADGELTDDPIPPGGSSFVLGAIGNIGDTIAKGIEVSVTLPKHVTFAEEEPGCTYTADNRTVTCNYKDITLIPLDEDTNEDDDLISVVGIYFPVTVAKDAPGPVVLKGGKLSGFALATENEVTASILSNSKTNALPKGLKALSAKSIDDANPADNTAEFAVHVAAPASGGNGGNGGNGGGLPVTGTQVGLISGVGGGVLAIGLALFVISRRRRVVLVTPDDEKPTA